MDRVAEVVGYGFMIIGALGSLAAAVFLVRHIILSLIFLRRLNRAGITWKTNNPLKHFEYAFTFSSDCVGIDGKHVFFPGREWRE